MSDGDSNQGPATNRENNPVADPTSNVLDLVEAANRRQDDLRVLTTAHLQEVMALRASHAREIRDAESRRIDAVRAVDVQAVAAAAQAAEARAGTLAAQVAAAAEAMRTANADAIAGAQTALAAALAPLTLAVQEVQRRQYEAAGEKVATTETKVDQRSGLGVLIGVAGVLVGLLALIASVVIALVV